MGHHNNRTPRSKQLREGAGPAHRGRGGGRLAPAFLESSCPQCSFQSRGAIRAQGSGKADQHLPRLSSLTEPSLDHVFGPKDLLCSGNAFPVPLLSRSASVILPQAFAYTQCSPPPTPFLQASPPSGSSPSPTTGLLFRLPRGPGSLVTHLPSPHTLLDPCLTRTLSSTGSGAR